MSNFSRGQLNSGKKTNVKDRLLVGINERQMLE